MKYTLVDLRNIRTELGEHYDNREAQTYTGRCSECNEPVAQFECKCTVCDTPVVWSGSKSWRQLYGQPSSVENLLLRTPSDDDGITLVALANVKAFPTPRALVRWNLILEQMNPHELWRIIDRCSHSLVKREQRSRGLIAFVLSSCEKFIRENDKLTHDRDEILEYGGGTG